MTRVLSHTFVLALASSLQLGYAQDQPITVPAIARPAPVPLTRLIDANPPPPPVAPSLSRSANRLKTVVDIVSAAGPAFNEMMVTRAYKQQFNIELEKGLKEANRLGQRGVLVKSFVVTETVEAGQYLSRWRTALRSLASARRPTRSALPLAVMYTCTRRSNRGSPSRRDTVTLL